MKKIKKQVDLTKPARPPVIREITAAILDSVVGGNSIRSKCGCSSV
jgi:hypothetical protein